VVRFLTGAKYYSFLKKKKKSPDRGLWGPNQPPSVKRGKREVHQSYIVTRLRIPPGFLRALMGLMRITLPAYTAIISLPEVGVFCS